MKQQKMLCKVIVLTIHNEIEYLVKALEIGCDGFILKDSDFDTLKKAIFSVYSGETYIEPSLTILWSSANNILTAIITPLSYQTGISIKKSEPLSYIYLIFPFNNATRSFNIVNPNPEFLFLS